MDEETKVKILKIHDPAESVKTLDSQTVEELASKTPVIGFWKEARSGEMNKIFRIMSSSCIQICDKLNLFSDAQNAGLYYNHSLINHSCVPNSLRSWVMMDFKRQQVRAIMTIEKNQEILVSYQSNNELLCGSRVFRRQKMLEMRGFLCQCSECSLEGEDLEDNEKMREELREKEAEIKQLLSSDGSPRIPRRDLQKVMKLAQRRVKLMLKLNIRTAFVAVMKEFYHLSVEARRQGISCENDPDIYKREALKYAKMFGDCYLYKFNNI